MSRELIARLRTTCGRTTGHGERCDAVCPCRACSEKVEAADALEEAGRKLAIAVEALRMAEHTEDCAAICGPENETWIEHSRCNCCIGKALAQIMGET